MWANTSPLLEEDTYCPQEAQSLLITVQLTLPLHGSLRQAVATGVTTGFVAKGQNWLAEARAHFPEVFTEVAAESVPLRVAQS